jgi:phosphatidylglycerophosphatase A
MWEKLERLAGFVPDRWVKAACTLGPVGRWGKAPGTNGSILGILLYTVIFFPLALPAEALLAVLLAVLAVPLCGRGEQVIGKRDPGEMILDEVVAIPFCFIGLKGYMAETGAVWAYMLAGFLLFRLFDILKPFGISSLQKHAGGLGVVIDDLAAAVATNLTIRFFLFALSFGGWIA